MFKGVFLILFAAVLFGVIYYYPVYLSPLSSIDIFCWRLIMSLPAILALTFIEREWQSVVAIFERIKRQPLFILALLASAFLIGIQMFIFVWAPLNGKSLTASLGYTMLPLVMVICGKVIYKEHFSLLKKIAIFFAIVGVVAEIYLTRAFSWDTLVIMLGYPLYIIFRREMKIDGIAGTLSDFFFLAIACTIYFIYNYDFNKISSELLNYPYHIPLFGILTAVAFSAYFSSAKILPIGLFGLLTYIEPILLMAVSVFFYKEALTDEQIIPHLLIWFAVLILICEGTIYSIKQIKYYQRLKNKS